MTPTAAKLRQREETRNGLEHAYRKFRLPAASIAQVTSLDASEETIIGYNIKSKCKLLQQASLFHQKICIDALSNRISSLP